MRTNPVYRQLWQLIEQTESVHKLIKGKSTVFQLVQVQLTRHPEHHFLLANTHLYFRPDAYFVRLLQSIVAIRHIHHIRNQILESNHAVKRVDILFGGDFNSTPDSLSFDYLANGRIDAENLLNGKNIFCP